MYTCDIQTGWLIGADQVFLSPHCDPRPNNTPIDMLVIHGIHLPEGDISSLDLVDALFMGTLDTHARPDLAILQGLQVSAHLLIDRNGRVTQYVPFVNRAWHAGNSLFEGKPQCNDFSIGIELHGADTIPYTEAQYKTLAQLSVVLQQAYPSITRDRMVGHSDIAQPAGRKTDPGPAFSWGHFDSLRRQIQRVSFHPFS